MTELLIDLVSSDRVNGCYCLAKLFQSKCWHYKLQICLIVVIAVPIWKNNNHSLGATQSHAKFLLNHMLTHEQQVAYFKVMMEQQLFPFSSDNLINFIMLWMFRFHCQE